MSLKTIVYALLIASTLALTLPPVNRPSPRLLGARFYGFPFYSIVTPAVNSPLQIEYVNFPMLLADITLITVGIILAVSLSTQERIDTNTESIIWRTKDTLILAAVYLTLISTILILKYLSCV